MMKKVIGFELFEFLAEAYVNSILDGALIGFVIMEFMRRFSKSEINFC